MLRRDFLRGAAAVPAAALASQRHIFGQVPWDQGELLHLLPTVSDVKMDDQDSKVCLLHQLRIT